MKILSRVLNGRCLFKGLLALLAIFLFQAALLPAAHALPIQAVVRGDGNRAYTVDTVSTRLKIFNTSSFPSVSQVGLGMSAIVLGTGQPLSLAILERDGNGDGSIDQRVLYHARGTVPPVVRVMNVNNVDPATVSTTITLPSGSSPAGMAISKDKDRLFIADSNSTSSGGTIYHYSIDFGANPTVGVYTAQSNITGVGVSGTVIHSIAVNPVSGNLYVSDRGTGAIHRVRTPGAASPAVDDNIITGLGTPTHLGISADGKLLFVKVLEASADIRVYNLASESGSPPEITGMKINRGGSGSVHPSNSYEGLWVERNFIYFTKYQSSDSPPLVHLYKYSYRPVNSSYEWATQIPSQPIELGTGWLSPSSGPWDSLIYNAAANANRVWRATSNGGVVTAGTLDDKPPAVVTNRSPSAGPGGTVVTITGFNLIPTGYSPDNFPTPPYTVARFVLRSDPSVSANATVTSVNPTTVTAAVPNSLSPGTYDLFLYNGGSSPILMAESERMSFVVSNPAPTVMSITPNSGVRGTTVSITNLAGTGFLSGATVVLGRSGQSDIPMTGVTVVSPIQITGSVAIPADATTGTWNVRVTNSDGQSGTGVNLFTINNPAPTISTFSPTSGIQGTTVSPLTINGTGFLTGATAQLTRTGQSPISMTVSAMTATQITASLAIPVAAVTGGWNVQVANTDGQSVTSADSFTVNSAVSDPPSAPLSLTATKSGSNLVLTWTASAVGPVDTYRVYRSTELAVPIVPANLIGTVTPPALTYTNTGALSAGVTYYYKVTAVNAAGESPASNPAYLVVRSLTFNPPDSGLGNKSWISIPYANPYTTAQDIVNDLNGGALPGAVNQIVRLNPSNQQFESLTYNDVLGWIADPGPAPFAIVVGEAFEITIQSSASLILTGSHNPSFVMSLTYNTPDLGLGNKHWISIPYNSPYALSQDLVNSMNGGSPTPGTVTDAARFNPSNQQFENMTYNDILGWIASPGPAAFAINSGEGYEVTINANTTWQPVAQ